MIKHSELSVFLGVYFKVGSIRNLASLIFFNRADISFVKEFLYHNWALSTEGFILHFCAKMKILIYSTGTYDIYFQH